MFEYDIYNPTTKESSIIFGYDVKDAFSRTKLDSKDWIVETEMYID